MSSRNDDTSWLSGDSDPVPSRRREGRRGGRRREPEPENEPDEGSKVSSAGGKYSEKDDTERLSSAADKPRQAPSNGWGVEGKTSSSASSRRTKPTDEDGDRKKKTTKKSNFFDDDDGDDIPTIPDLDEEEPEEVAPEIAAAPKARQVRMSSLKELDSDLKHSLRDRVSAGIDLSLLTSALLPQSSAVEPDISWEVDTLFEAVAQELHAELAAPAEVVASESSLPTRRRRKA
jgi:hypothetical protein